ncbi:S-adenosyl-L-methionine-dependent methyltransferase [Xylariaceae sp. FL1019]|nr:S-adenosyl-L-methionine-dependent methyltransferase [Xylariaceae sp. FL1019]
MANAAKASADFSSTAQSVLTNQDDAARKQLLSTAMQATAMLESPVDTVWKMIMSAGVIQEIAKAKPSVTADHLASVSGADRLLIVRLLRPLAALGVVKETSQEVYAPTPITKVLVDCALLGGYQFMFPAATRSLANLPYYLEKTDYKHGAKDDPNATLLIDIAGGEGHDVAEFHNRFPDAPGRLIVQDTPPVIDSIQDLTSKVERQKYDFFTEQPINGARRYYFRSIFHDWPDNDCIAILKNTAAAMTPGYSKLLMSEFALPSSNTPLYPALLDVNMMALLNGMERTEAQFTALLDAAGFNVVKFWSVGAETEGLIEAVLKD